MKEYEQINQGEIIKLSKEPNLFTNIAAIENVEKGNYQPEDKKIVLEKIISDEDVFWFIRHKAINSLVTLDKTLMDELNNLIHKGGKKIKNDSELYQQYKQNKKIVFENLKKFGEFRKQALLQLKETI